MQFIGRRKILTVVLIITYFPSPINAQSLQDFIRDHTRGGLVNNTPLKSTNNSSNNNLKTQNRSVIDEETKSTTNIQGSGEFVTVKRGDTLSSIADRKLGSTEHWETLCRLNQRQNNCNDLVIGEKIELPSIVFNHRKKIALEELSIKLRTAHKEEIAGLKSQIQKLKAELKLTKVVHQNFEKALIKSHVDLKDYERRNANLSKILREYKPSPIDLYPIEQATPLDLRLEDTHYVIADSLAGKNIILRDFKNRPINNSKWSLISAYSLPNYFFVIRKNKKTNKQYGVYFDRLGNFLGRTPSFQTSDIEALVKSDLNLDGRIGSKLIIEAEGDTTVISDEFGRYTLVNKNNHIRLRSIDGNYLTTSNNISPIHAEQYWNGFLVLFRRSEQIGSFVVNNAGVFMDWYDVKSYHDFFETTSSYLKQN